MRLNRYYFLPWLLCLTMVGSLSPAFSQGEDLGNWLMYFGTNRISDNWSIHSEIQHRNHTVKFGNIEQLLLRTGVNYHLSSSAILTGGLGYIDSYVFESPQDGPETSEWRFFQQMILINQVGRLKFEHRYRLEQRWVNSDFRHRVRYRFMAFLPLNKPQITKGSVFFALYDEIFLNTEQTFFDRNRFYLALGYQISPISQIQVGWMRQQVNDFGKNYLQLGFVFNPDLRGGGS